MKRIYLLIGPKGSGKSYIGEIFQRKYGITFIRVENWVKEIRRGRAVDDKSYISEVFRVIEEGVIKELSHRESIVFESTGFSEYFDRMLSSLKLGFETIVIRIQADKQLCLDRVKKRDQSIHINISDEDVVKINNAVEHKMVPCDFEINNNNAPDAELEKIISSIIR